MKKTVLLFGLTLLISLFTSCSDNSEDVFIDEEQNEFSKDVVYQNMFGQWSYNWHYLSNEYDQTDESKHYDYYDYSCDGGLSNIVKVEITKDLVTIKTNRTDFGCETLSYSFEPILEKNNFGDIRLLNSNLEYQFTLRYLKESTGSYTYFYFQIEKENSPKIVKDIFLGTEEVLPENVSSVYIRMSKFESPKK